VNNELEAVLKENGDKHGICPASPRKNTENPRKITSDKTVKFQGKIQN
jgi:hypothetical protein